MVGIKGYNFNNFLDLKKNICALTDGQLYIYALLNDEGYIKIGQTTNPYQRFCSLSGSNGAGHKITQYYVSPSTWLYSLEVICHNHFDKYRFPKTEWFYGQDLSFDIVISFIENLFLEKDYKTCNEARRIHILEAKKKGKAKCQRRK